MTMAMTYQLSDNSTNTRASGQRELALFQNLRVALLVGVFHQGDHLCLFRVGDQVHCATEALDLAGQHPVGEIAARRDLHGAQHAHVNAAGADHAEALLGAETAGPRVQGDGLLAGVDQVGVLLALDRVGPQAENAVFGLQLHLDRRVDEAGREHGHADAQVGVHAILELQGGALDDALALARRVALAEAVLDVGVLVLAERELFNLLLRRALDHLGHVDAGQVHRHRVDLAHFDNVFGLDDGDAGVAAHGAVEVVGREPELGVAQLVGLVGLDEGVVPLDGFFHDVALAVEHLYVSRLAKGRNAPVCVVAERDFAGLHHRAEGRGGVECGYTLASCRTPFGERALGREFEFDFAGQVLLFEHLVLTDVTGDHLADLLGRQELAETGSGDTCVVGDGRQSSNGGLFCDGVNQRVGHATQTEATAE